MIHTWKVSTLTHKRHPHRVNPEKGNSIGHVTHGIRLADSRLLRGKILKHQEGIVPLIGQGIAPCTAARISWVRLLCYERPSSLSSTGLSAM